jgi:hypothetical protein
VSDSRIVNRETALAWIGTPGFDSEGNAAPTCLKKAAGAPGSSVGAFEGDNNPIAAFFEGLGHLFGLGGTQAEGSPALFDLGAILGKVLEVFTPKAETKATEAASVSEHAHVEGRFEAGGISGEGSADAEAYAKATATGRAWAGPDGVGVEGEVGATAGVSARTKGALHTPVGDVRGYAGVSVELYARAKGYAIANTKGADAAGTAEVGAMARAEAGADAEVLGGMVTGKVDAEAESGTGAVATGHVAISYDPPTAVLEGAAGAFAGARAGFSAKGGIAGVEYGIEAEAWAGAGAKAEFHAGLGADGKFHFSMGAGVALGVGVFFKVDFALDFKDVGSTVSSLVGAGATIVGGVVSAVGTAFGGVGKGVADFFGGIFGAVAGLFGGGQGDGSHAASILDTFKPLFDTLTGSAKPANPSALPETENQADGWTSDAAQLA